MGDWMGMVVCMSKWKRSSPMRCLYNIGSSGMVPNPYNSFEGLRILFFQRQPENGTASNPSQLEPLHILYIPQPHRIIVKVLLFTLYRLGIITLLKLRGTNLR